MAEHRYLTIVDSDYELVSGGAFRLDETPTEHQLIEIDDWEVEIEPGSPYIFARTPGFIACRSPT